MGLVNIKITTLIIALGAMLTVTSCKQEEVKTEPSRNQSVSLSTLNSDAFYRDARSIVSPAKLHEMIDKGENFALIDVREAAEYATGHLPGALNCWRSDFNHQEGEIGGLMASRGQIATMLSRMGIRPETQIVLYDDRGNVNAARLWWILTLYGHESVSLLNGGLQGWQASEFALDTLSPTPTPFEYVFVGNPKEFMACQMAAFEAPGDTVRIVDTRTPEEFSGQRIKKGAFAGGHIPGAIFLNYVEAVNASEGEDFSFRPIEFLKEKYAAHGITSDKKILTYCHSGARSAHTTFVLTQLLGFPEVANYDGSWMEWSFHHRTQDENTLVPN